MDLQIFGMATKNTQIKHCPCMVLFTDPTFKAYRPKKNSWKNRLNVETDLSKYASTKQRSVLTLYKHLRCQNKMYDLQTRFERSGNQKKS